MLTIFFLEEVKEAGKRTGRIKVPGPAVYSVAFYFRLMWSLVHSHTRAALAILSLIYNTFAAAVLRLIREQDLSTSLMRFSTTYT